MRQPIALLSFALALACLAGCHHSIPDTTTPSGRPVATMPAPADSALFVVFHGGRDETNVVLFTADGTPVCQIPHASHCVMALAPGHYRIYITYDRSFTDAWDLDVAPGRTYYATTAVGWSFMDEKLTPASSNWGHLAEYLLGAEVALDPSQVPFLREELGNYEQLVEQGDHRMEHYDERHLEVHTIRPEDGV